MEGHGNGNKRYFDKITTAAALVLVTREGGEGSDACFEQQPNKAK
jgi:hypothetical protein